MKTLLSIVIILMVYSFVFAQNADEEAIKNIVTKETLSFYHCDATAWESPMITTPGQ